jgi:hypothetical protein
MKRGARWRRVRRGGWSRTTIWRMRLVLGRALPKEPVFLAVERSMGETLRLLRVHVPHFGAEIWVCRRVIWWRRMLRVARTSVGLSAAMDAWEQALEGSELRRWLSEPTEPVRLRDPRKLEKVLCRALVLEVLGRRSRARRR